MQLSNPLACGAVQMAAAHVISTTHVAARTYDKLCAGATPEQLHDLGHGKIELLREVVTKVIIREEYGEHIAVQDFLAMTLLHIRALLLGWESGGIPDKLLELPLVKLPKQSPNRCWKCKHPRKDILLEEAKECVCYLSTRRDIFADEPWEWLLDVMDSIVLALEHR